MSHVTAIYYSFVILAVGLIAVAVGVVDDMLRLFDLVTVDRLLANRLVALIVVGLALYVLAAGFATSATPERSHPEE